MKLNKTEVLLVAGGAIGSCLVGKILKSKTTRKSFVKVIAKGLEAKDNLEYSITKVKEEAEDIYAEAVIKNTGEAFEDLEETSL